MFHLDLELSSRYQVEYINSSVQSIVPYESGLTVQETLGSERVDIVPRVFFVATHKDCVSDQPTYIRHTTLLAVVKRTEAYREGMVQFPSKSRLIPDCQQLV